MERYNNGGKIEHQRNSSWCSAFSCTSYLTAYFSRILGKKIEFSPLMAIRNSKLTDGNKTSTGTYVDNLMKEIVKNGCCELDLYHESTDKDWLDNKFEEPSKEAIENAKLYKPYEMKKIDVKVKSLMDAVDNNGGCILSLNVFKNYFDPFRGYAIRRPLGIEENVEGRHAIYLCAYDTEATIEYDGYKYKGVFYLQESYGSNKLGGYKVLPFDFIEKRVGGKYSCDRFVDEARIFTYKESPKYNDIDKDFKISIPKKTVKLTLNSKVAFVNDKRVELQCPAIEENGRTFVPIRFISEAFGASVNFIQSRKEIRIFSTEPNYLIVMQVGNKEVFKSERGVESKVASDVAPFIKDGYTLVPLRVIGELIGCRVDFDGKTKEITISEQ